MATQVAAPTTAHEEYNPARLFIISCLSLATGALVFSLFANIRADLANQFLLDAATVGWAAGAWGLGLAFSIFIGSSILDTLGMGRLLTLACLLQILGVLTIVFTPVLAESIAPVQALYLGQLILGIGHGLIEAVINPLAATVYPDDKTHRLNVLHAWWPGGLVIGGLLGFALGQAEIGWRKQYALILLPAAVYGLMLIGQRFPQTERKAAGVSTAEMWSQALRPLYIIWWCCMLLTAAMELGPAGWVEAMMSQQVGFSGILILVYISGLMFVMRHFAGPLAHKLSPVGLMWISSLLAGLGLLALSYAASPVMALLAATVWGVGVCYMWPTMLGVTSERFPRGGAVLMGLTGTAGMLSIQFVTPIMGRIYDNYTQEHLPPGLSLQDAIARASGDPSIQTALDQARLAGAPFAFRYVAACSLVLLVVFGIIWMRDQAMGGYRAERLESVELGQADPGDFSAAAVLEAEEDNQGTTG